MRLVLRGATVYASPDEKVERDVFIDGEEIVDAAPSDARVVDCSGLTVTAGLWNSHVHFFERKWADADAIPMPELSAQLQATFSRYGFTNVFDLGSLRANTQRLRERVERPRIRTTGEGLLPAGGAPPEAITNFMGLMKTPMPEVSSAAEAATATRALLDGGVDGIKLFLRTNIAAIEAAVAEAHRAGKRVFAHTNNGAEVLAALRGGVDVIAHTTPHSGPWDDAILAAVSERRVALTPTLSLWRYYARHDRLSAQDKIRDAAAAQLRAWIDAGGIVLFGTDLGAVDPDPSEEYELMSRAGMSFAQILASLTTAPAEFFGEPKRGRVAVGYAADLVVWRDPLRATSGDTPGVPL